MASHKVRGIRSMTNDNPDHPRSTCAEHWAMIAALQRGDRAELVALCERHIIPSLDLYLARAKSRQRPG